MSRNSWRVTLGPIDRLLSIWLPHALTGDPLHPLILVS
jgi:hypothetical protein